MLEFLSPEWLVALDEAGRAATPAPEAHIDLVIEQVVTGDGAPADAAQGDAERDGTTDDGATDDGDPSITYHVELTGGRARFHPGPAERVDLRFTADRATAWAIASGTDSAQRAFMAGRLRVGGDLRALHQHPDALGALGDAFAAVRERSRATTPPAPGTVGS